MNGIILVDKPEGPTSAEIVRRLKPYVRPARIGHLGTLDPFATGVLPIMIGEATKLAPFLQDGEKEYRGIIALGTETDTLDRSGVSTRSASVPPLDSAMLDEIAKHFTGDIEQTPPIFSAIKREGVPLYRRARRGEQVAPPAPRQIRINRLELHLAASDRLEFIVVCSPGTYVRSLARDLGVALGTAAHLSELRRVRNGIFRAEEASPIDDVIMSFERGTPKLISLRAALPDIAEVEADCEQERRLRNGDSRTLDSFDFPQGHLFKVVNGNRLLAIADRTSRVTAKILRVFNE